MTGRHRQENFEFSNLKLPHVWQSTPKRQGISSLFAVLNVFRCRTLTKLVTPWKPKHLNKSLWPFSYGGMMADAINFIVRRSNASYTSVVQGTCLHNFLNPLSLSFGFLWGLFCFYKQGNINKSAWEQVLGPEVLAEEKLIRTYLNRLCN